MKHKCDVCGKMVSENELYGKWGDYCHDCWFEEGKDDEIDKNDPYSTDDEY